MRSTSNAIPSSSVAKSLRSDAVRMMTAGDLQTVLTTVFPRTESRSDRIADAASEVQTVTGRVASTAGEDPLHFE